MRNRESGTRQETPTYSDGRLAAQLVDAWVPDPDRAQRIKTIVAIYQARDEAAERQARREDRQRRVVDSIVVAVMLLGGLFVSRLLYEWGYTGPARLLAAGMTLNLLAWVAMLVARRRGQFRDR